MQVSIGNYFTKNWNKIIFCKIFHKRNLLMDSRDRGAKALLIIHPCGDVMRREDWMVSF